MDRRFRKLFNSTLRRKLGEMELQDLLLDELSDEELALLQSESVTESPEFRLIEFEWQSRLLARQINHDRRNAILAGSLGVVGSLGGVALGYFLSRLGNSTEIKATPPPEQKKKEPEVASDKSDNSPAIPDATSQ